MLRNLELINALENSGESGTYEHPGKFVFWKMHVLEIINHRLRKPDPVIH